MKKRVYIIYTGGTIGMQPTPEGYAPAPGYLAEQIMSMPELQSDLMPEVEIQEYDPLLDSANMTPEDWYKIARDIGTHYHEYDGLYRIGFAVHVTRIGKTCCAHWLANSAV